MLELAGYGRPRAKAGSLARDLAGKVRQLGLTYGNDRPARVAIWSLVLANLFFIGLHAFAELGDYAGLHDIAYDSPLLLTTDYGYSELFNYAQLLAIVAMLGLVYARTRQVIYLALGGLFLYALVEDAGRLHEAVGRLAEGAGLAAPFGMGAYHFAQMAHWSLVGAVLGLLTLAGFAASASEDRRIGLVFLALVGVLAFFVAAVDALHALAADAFLASGVLLTLAEDGGELLTIAAILSAALLLCRHPDRLRRPA